MIIDKFPKDSIDKYTSHLRTAGMLTRLYSKNDTPYIVPRAAENIFCTCTGAKDIGRSDHSVDAVLYNTEKGNNGIGIKTFINGNGNTLQKISEFDKDSHLFRSELPEKKVRIISDLHNARLEYARRNYDLSGMYYHCIVRGPGCIMVYEEPMKSINIKGIKKVSVNSGGATISFEDGINEYSFNVNKSTLYKRFKTQNVLLSIPVQIIDDPYTMLSGLFAGSNSVSGSADGIVFAPPAPEYPRIVLPLFSNRGGKNVPEKSGLNQWNAEGRRRDLDEAYIPVPAWIHSKYPDFFPPRDRSFNLHLPNESVMSAKICQQGGKALMSNPNSSLGKWLLRDILMLPEGTLATYDMLQKLDIDSVEITKKGSGEYCINFLPVGSYDEFEDENRH